jgi:hypothetical protein
MTINKCIFVNRGCIYVNWGCIYCMLANIKKILTKLKKQTKVAGDASHKPLDFFNLQIAIMPNIKFFISKSLLENCLRTQKNE